MWRDSAERETRFVVFGRLPGHETATGHVTQSTWTSCASTAEPDGTALHNTCLTLFMTVDSAFCPGL